MTFKHIIVRPNSIDTALRILSLPICRNDFVDERMHHFAHVALAAPHQQCVFEGIAHHLAQFLVVLIENLDLLYASDWLTTRLEPPDGRVL